MGGYREFAPGQVWFYYNPAATKHSEEKSERGAITSRPVVIIQNAVYSEWADTISVVPITRSDRRSGVYIDTTILRDGVKIEGGTILPYLFYTVKTKFLYAIKGMDGRRRIVSLQEEDFEKVRHGYLYHLGERKDPPDYVLHWKHLDDVEKRKIVHSVKLFVNDFEDALSDEHIGKIDYQYSKVTKKEYPTVDVSKNDIATEGETVTKKKVTFSFESITLDQFYDVMEEEVSENLSLSKDLKRIYSEKKILDGKTTREAVDSILTDAECAYVMSAPITEIVENTGIGSSSSVSRLRNLIQSEKGITKENWKDYIRYPEPFRFNGTIKTNPTRIRRNAKRRKLLFSLSKEEHLKIASMPVDQILKRFPEIPRNIAKNLCVDIEFLYPSQVINRFSNIRDRIATTNTANIQKYELFETLSIQEAKEIAQTDKRNIQTIAKIYGIHRDKARALRGTAINMISRYPTIEIELLNKNEIENSIKKFAKREYDQITDRDLYIFCRTDALDIVKGFNNAHSPNRPSKEEIQNIKFDIRSRIVKTVI